MNVLEFNKVIYKGNINKDFYLYCIKKDIKLIRFIFINLIYFIISIIFKSKKDIYEKKKFKYLKYVKNIDKENNIFYKNIKYNDYLEIHKDIIIDKIPKILINDKTGKKIIGYELNKDYEVNINKFYKEVDDITTCDNLYVRNRYNLKDIKFNKLFNVNNNKFKFLRTRRLLNDNSFKLLIMIFLSLIITCISFCYTNYVLDKNMLISYFEPLLFIMNFIPIFLLVVLFSIISKRIHIAYLLTSIIILIFGVANQTKILYRDDIVKFEDLTIIKEAMTMSARYDIVIKWYTIMFIVLSIILFFIVRRFVHKYEFKIKKQVLLLMSILFVSIFSYNLLYKNEDIYNKVGAQSLINVWITTRQYQIRGLVYPFIYTLEDFVDKEPVGYDENKVKEIIESYQYENISEDKKVNIIAIMLEAYNDFSKFGVIDFDEDIYEKFHEIQDKSISGNLVTTIFGGGTIVTERNFLTGYTDFPNLRKNTNSYVWYFKEQGYKTEAMHPIYGAFYNRASINPYLGFDNYYYYENKFNSVSSDFLEDYDFFDYIIEGYKNAKTDNVPYFNFSVTYQNHGPYYGESYGGKEYFFENNGYDLEGYNTINEYFSGIKKTNIALEKLINYFENEEEPTIIILFGDHNPFLGDNALAYNTLGIDMSLDNLEGFKNYYQTPYIIYGNNSAKKTLNNDFVGTGEDISPIFLMNKVFELCSFNGNEYMQYTSELKEKVDVISNFYYKENGIYVKKEESKYQDIIDEYNYVNYYVSRNYGGK